MIMIQAEKRTVAGYCVWLPALLLAVVMPVDAFAASQQGAFAWPEITSTSRPWSYWWWLGSAVDRPGLTAFLGKCRDAGMGGMHVIPIYGVKGLEPKYLDYLSPQWMQMLHWSVEEADRLGMGIDMSTGTGWPFGGGPEIGAEHGCKRIVMQQAGLGRELLRQLVDRPDRYQAIVTVSDQGDVLDVKRGMSVARVLQYAAKGAWRVYAVGQEPSRGRVERAAPGAEGLVIDPFSPAVLTHYLKRFDAAFSRTPGKLPRAQYHDSYEYPGASWTDDFFAEFQSRRGYDLRRRLPAFFGRAGSEQVARVKADYRTTIAELHLEYVRTWVAWSHQHGCLTRNQAHGSPANILDTYAAADIPETESFGTPDLPIPGLRLGTKARTAPPHPLVTKFASSAAHTSGKRLTAAESCTWLGEHFNVPLGLAKLSLDQLLLAGVNHVVYHGMAYSPPDAPWPGWRFYASTNFSPTNNFWRDLPALNAYVARCQAVLQSGRPSADVLLYFPVHDVRHNPGGLLQHYTIHGVGWMQPGGLQAAAKTLWQRGYAFDYVSDDLLKKATVTSQGIQLGNATYQVILIPACRFMPIETLRRVIALAADGATVVFAKDYPQDVPGLHEFEKRRQILTKLRESLPPPDKVEGARTVQHGSGRLLLGGDLDGTLKAAGIRREAMVDHDVQFVRRRHEQGYHYFIAKVTPGRLDGWIPLGVAAESVVILDPRFADRAALAAVKRNPDGTAACYLQLDPGQSLILRTFDACKLEGPRWTYLQVATDRDRPTLQLGESANEDSECLTAPVSRVSSEYPGREANLSKVRFTGVPAESEAMPVKVLDVTWKVDFIRGAPKIPSPFETSRLDSWTALGDEEAKRVAGTARYRTRFTLPDDAPDQWVLDLGTVCDSARVTVNGHPLGTLFCLPFSMPIGNHLRPGENLLEVEVTNLDANRIADLDRRGVVWRKFHEINFVNIHYRPFDASAWPLRDSGLLGPVRLYPCVAKRVDDM